MSASTLLKNVDDQFPVEAREKTAAARMVEKMNRGKDPGDYHKEAQRWLDPDTGNTPIPTTRYFGEMAKDEGVYPDDGERRYWEDYWCAKLKVNRYGYYEPKRERKVKQFASDWWAVMRLFEDQKSPAWPDAPTAIVEKAFTTTSLQTVFPIFFDTQIQAGLLADPVLDRLVSRTQPVNSHNATHLKMTETDANSTMGEAGEGTTFVQLLVQEAERTIKLRKFGGEINWTYEVMRLARIDELAVYLQRVGTRYNQLKTDYALSVLIDGDGAGDGAATTSAATTSGTPVYGDLVAAEFVFPQGYTPDTFIAPKQVLIKLLNMAEYKDPLAGILHQTRGGPVNPLGYDQVRWDSTGRVSTYLSTTALMLDSEKALVEYTEGGIITETDRIIRTQWELSVISQWVGYGVWDRNAAVLLTAW